MRPYVPWICGTDCGSKSNPSRAMERVKDLHGAPEIKELHMARREMGKLSPAKIKSVTRAGEHRPGVYGDGGGLYLNVGPTGAASWLFRFMLNGKAREMGLGPLHTIGLAEAR